MSYLSLLLVLVLQGAAQAPVPGMPAEAGVYFRQNETQWRKMETAPLADMKSKGMTDFLETDGYTNLAMTVAYVGDQAKLRIPSAKPTFYVRGAGPAKDAMIIALARGKKARVIRTDSAAATVGNRAGFRKEEIRTVVVISYTDGSFSVTPEEDLRPGEFALVFGFPNAAYDFAVTRPKSETADRHR